VEQEKKGTGKHSWLSRLWARTGFGDKTVWDWLQLLIVPLVLGVIGFYFTSSQEYAHQQEFEEQRLQNAALQTYLAGMRELLLDQHLRASAVDSEVRAVARAETRSTLGQLSPEGQGIAIQFLYEASLIKKEDPIISLSHADLRGADLSQLDLSGADLSGADLSGADLRANLSGANLSGASLSGANLSPAALSNADLSGADLSEVDLSNAVLSNADLSGAYLRDADLSPAYLGEANLSEADLSEADLSYADLKNANLSGAKGVTNEQLEQQDGLTLEGAIMPNGQKYEDWLKSKGRGQ
jgi:uncharacterized protein YjbI with pentapeptide repeats